MELWHLPIGQDQVGRDAVQFGDGFAPIAGRFHAIAQVFQVLAHHRNGILLFFARYFPFPRWPAPISA